MVPRDVAEHDELLLRVVDLTVQFPTYQGVVRAVEGVNLDVRRGQVIGLVGETSCGKSVTGLAILRLLPFPGRIVRGQVLFEGRDLLSLGEKQLRQIRGKGITLISQNPMTSLSPVFTIGKQLSDVLAVNRGLGRKARRTGAAEVLRDVAMPDPEKILRAYSHELSGGMQQRVTIAEALGCNTRLLIADEPTTALDVSVQLQILKLLKGLVLRRGLSIIMISHDIGIIANMCDHVYVMYAGRIVEHGPTRVILNFPLHPYSKALIEAVPRFKGHISELRYLQGDVPDPIELPSGCPLHPRCPESSDECVTSAPELVEIGGGHFAACHRMRTGREPGSLGNEQRPKDMSPQQYWQDRFDQLMKDVCWPRAEAARLRITARAMYEVLRDEILNQSDPGMREAGIEAFKNYHVVPIDPRAEALLHDT